MYKDIVNIYNIDTHNEERLKRRVRDFLGHIGCFDDDIWVYTNCEGYKVSAHTKYTINFTSILPQYKEITKYFTLSYYGAPSTYNHYNYWVNHFFEFLENNFSINNISEVNYNALEQYKAYLVNTDEFKPSTKQYKWIGVKVFFRIMRSFKGFPQIQFPNDPYFNFEGGLDEFEIPIPVEIYYTLDKVFLDYSDSLPIHYQLIYWTLRLIPSRVNEVLDMDLNNCKRPAGERYVITIPVPKNSTVFKLKKKMIYINESAEVEKFFIELLNKQIKISKELQNRVKSEGLTPNLLFTTLRIKTLSKGRTPFSLERHEYRNTLVGRVSDECFNSFLEKVIKLADNVLDESGDKKYDFRDEKNELIVLTSHKLRREAISSRIDYGFQIQDVAFLSGLDVEETIWTYYDSSATRSVKPIAPIFNLNLQNNEVIKTNSLEEDGKLSISNDSKVQVVGDSVLTFYQKSKKLRHVPLVTSDGLFLGNCGGDFYDCNRIKHEMTCLNCSFCKKDSRTSSLENIEKAIERYKSDIEFFKSNGNKKSESLARTNLERYVRLKEIMLINRTEY